MRRVELQITDELHAAIEAARGDAPRNPQIEEWLWRIPEIKKAAKSLGIKKPTRRKPGRPHAED